MAESTDKELSASDIESFVGALSDFLAETKCPRCNSSDASMYKDVEDVSNVKVCTSCDTVFGIDDSMNLNDLRQLFEEGNLRFKTQSSCACGNDDVHKFVFEKLCEQSGQLCLRCMDCDRTKDMEIIPADADIMHEETDDKLAGDDDQSSACPPLDDQVPQPFSCECGNEENELFDKVFDESESYLVSVRCWKCNRHTNIDRPTEREKYCLIECGKCGNNTKDLFETKLDESGEVVGIFCQVCELRETFKTYQQINFSDSNELPLNVSYTETKVTPPMNLKRADHIAWKRCGGIYSHHAIVVEVLSENQLDVIHNTAAEDGTAANGGAKCKILRGIVDVDLSKGDLYLCNYEPGECLEPDEVIARAESLLGEKVYNLFMSNCEHFATLCKTSKCFSSQVTSLVDFIRWFGSCAVKEVQEGAIVRLACKLDKPVAAKVLKFTTQGAIRRVTGSGLSGGVKALSTCGPVVINLAIEGIVFGVRTRGAFKEYKEGLINENEFRAKTADAGCSSGIRFACSSTGGVIGQLLIPVPFLGGFVGCTLGALVGHYFGKKAGKRASEAILKK